MMTYFAKISKQKDKTYLVEFPDAPGCLTEGETLSEAKLNAAEAINAWLAARCDRDLAIKKPKKRVGRGTYPIAVDIKIEFAVSLRMLRKHRGLTQSQVARKLQISQQAYAKLEIPTKTNPSLTTIQRLADALDAEFQLKLIA